MRYFLRLNAFSFLYVSSSHASERRKQIFEIPIRHYIHVNQRILFCLEIDAVVVVDVCFSEETHRCAE